MARTSGKDAFISWDGDDMSGESNSWTLNIENDVFDVTSFGDAAKASVEGKYGWTVDVEAFFDVSTLKWDVSLFGDLGAGAKAMTLAHVGTTPSSGGTVIYSGSAFIETFSDEAPVDGAVTVSATFRGTGALTRATS